jgi:hypothetical protein
MAEVDIFFGRSRHNFIKIRSGPQMVGFRIARDTPSSKQLPHESNNCQDGSVFPYYTIYINRQDPSFIFINSTFGTLIKRGKKPIEKSSCD